MAVISTRYIANLYQTIKVRSFVIAPDTAKPTSEAETGEPPISRQNALECTKSHIKFQNFAGGNGPPSTRGSVPRPPGREGGEGREKKGDKLWSPTFQTKVTPLLARRFFVYILALAVEK